MKDDELDELLRDAALSYNTPPEPPREAMWEAISRARSAATVVPIGAPRRTRWIATAAGIASNSACRRCSWVKARGRL